MLKLLEIATIVVQLMLRLDFKLWHVSEAGLLAIEYSVHICLMGMHFKRTQSIGEKQATKSLVINRRLPLGKCN